MMRACILVLVLVASGSSAYVVSDPAGDVVLQLPSGSVNHQAPQIDVVAAWVYENSDSLVFGMQFQGANETLDRQIEVLFSVRQHDFVLAFSEQCNSYALLMQRSLALQECVGLTSNSQNNSAELVVTKAGFEAVLGHVLGPGDTLESIRFVGFARTTVAFREFDEAFTGDPFFPTIPSLGTGPVLLFAEAPYHYSNGEPGAFSYNVTLRNSGSGDVFELNAVEVPDGWKVSHPNAVMVGENSFESFLVVVTIPSKHLHGETENVRLKASNSQHDAYVDIGLTFPEIPNPAGHHSTLYFHGDSPGFSVGGTVLSLWMNTESESDFSDEPYPSYMSGLEVPSVNGWLAQMQPRLQMGLDFIEGSQAWLNGSLEFDVPSDSVDASATLILDAREDVLIARSEWIPLEPGALVPFSLPLNLLQGVDVLPYEEKSNLVLELLIRHVGVPAPEQIRWVIQGSELYLPLTDFRPTIPTLPFSDIVVEGLPADDLRLNAGVQKLVTVDVSGPGGPFEVQVDGYHAEWFTHEQTVSSGGQVHFLISPPASTRVGDWFDVVLRIDGESGSWIHPLYGEVVEEPVAADEWVFEQKDTPSVLPLAPLIVALVLVWRKR